VVQGVVSLPSTYEALGLIPSAERGENVYFS
jgi:hypothetical protein